MSCTTCGQELPEVAAFCFACGAKVEPAGCAACGAALVPGAAYCLACGTSVTARTSEVAPSGSERRLTSILFADLVGYTTIAEGRDTEDVRELLSAYFDTCQTVIGRYGGTVEKFIGDAVMAVWGVPVSHEDDAERAVRAGLELVEQVAGLGDRLGIPELALRVGVVTGEVAATLGATDQGMVAGDPVNTAARVQSMARPGEVWVDAQTRSLTTAAVTYRDKGEHLLKGKAEPVQLYRAGAVVAVVGGLQRVDGLEAPLVGRDREMRLIKELFHAVEESGRPQLVVLDGEAGIGKSRLGWEFEKYIDGLRGTVRWHRGRCLSYGDGVAFWALAEMVRTRIGLLEEDSGAVVLMRLDEVLAEVVPEEPERDWLRPRVASLLGEESREFTREDLFSAWVRFFERVSGQDPVVLLIDDAEHLDDGLADFLEFLLETGRFPGYVLALARPEMLARRPQLGGRRSTPIHVGPLSERAMAQLLDGLVGGLPPEVRDQLVTRAEGIPLYAVETVRALIDRDLVVPSEGHYVVAEGAVLDLGAVGAPASLHALVSSRLDALSTEERRVVSDASVLGESFTREGIGILAGDVADLDAVLSSLIRKEIIATDVDRFSAERGQYRFVQTVVRQVAYATLSRKDRRSRHLRVAEHLAADTARADDLAQVIARHLLDAAAVSAPGSAEVAELSDRAGDLLVLAGERAGGLGAYTDASRLLASALECQSDPRARARTMLQRASYVVILNEFLECEALGREARALFLELDDAVGAAEAGFWISSGLQALDRFDEALDMVRTCYAELEGRGDVPARRARGRLQLRLGHLLVWSGRFAEAYEPLMEALELSEACGDEESYRRTCNALAVGINRMGGRRVALMILRGMVEMAQEAEDWVQLTVSLVNDAAIRASTDVQGALKRTLEAREVARGHGLPGDSVVYANTLTFAWLTGEWDRIERVLEELAEFDTDRRAAHDHAQAIAGLCASAGRPMTAPPTELVETDGPDRMPYLLAMAGRAIADDPESALAFLCEACRIEVRINGLGEDLHAFWMLAARLALTLEDSEALEELRAIPGLADHFAMTPHVQVFDALAALAGADPDLTHVEAELRQGIARLDATGHVLWAAHAREDLGRLMLRQGRPEEGRPLLEEARAAYEGMGAQVWVTRVDALKVVSA
jgi:class 3 adenylate cyclase/tetratricopeptide (TPR) repeat protein